MLKVPRLGLETVRFPDSTDCENMPDFRTGRDVMSGLVQTSGGFRNIIYILCRSQTFCAGPKNDLLLVNSVFGLALSTIQFSVQPKIIRLAQNNLGTVEGQGIGKRQIHVED